MTDEMVKGLIAIRWIFFAYTLNIAFSGLSFQCPEQIAIGVASLIKTSYLEIALEGSEVQGQVGLDANQCLIAVSVSFL